jgi:hypothetical protein
VTGSGTSGYLSKWNTSSSLNNSLFKQYTSPTGNGEYVGLNTPRPQGSLGILSHNGYEIFGMDSTKVFNIASGGSMYLQPGINSDAGGTSDPLARLSLGAGGNADLAVLQRKLLTIGSAVGVGLGVTPDTNFTTGYRLKVCGQIRATGIVTNTGWCDFVFDPSYPLTPLTELEEQIQSQGHLPGIPTTAEVEANGVELGAMTSKLLQKVEELTLYVIDLQKQNDTLRAQMASLPRR